MPPTVTPTNPPTFQNATFVYDGDGKRVKSIVNNAIITYFVGAHYEVSGSTVTKYYYAGSQRIAMRVNGEVQFIISDHLGSASLVTNAAGENGTDMRYKAWGKVRYVNGPAPTDYTYTGQYSYMDDFGLMFYQARWYDHVIGRFAQADSIVSGGVQGLDRYAYVNNSPLRYIDPSGHMLECSDQLCDKLQRPARVGKNGLTDPQIMKLVGFKSEDEFKKWRNSSPELYKLLQASNPGDIIHTSWSANGQTLEVNWMIAYDGKVHGDLVFYDTDNKTTTDLKLAVTCRVRG